jgi:hypothetical protein
MDLEAARRYRSALATLGQGLSSVDLPEGTVVVLAVAAALILVPIL